MQLVIGVDSRSELDSLVQFYSSLEVKIIAPFDVNFIISVEIYNLTLYFVVKEEFYSIQGFKSDQFLQKILHEANLNVSISSLVFKNPKSLLLECVSSQISDRFKKEFDLQGSIFEDPVGVRFKLVKEVPIIVQENDSRELDAVVEENMHLRFEMLLMGATTKASPVELESEEKYKEVISRLSHALHCEKANHANARKALESLCKDLSSSRNGPASTSRVRDQGDES